MTPSFEMLVSALILFVIISVNQQDQGYSTRKKEIPHIYVYIVVLIFQMTHCTKSILRNLMTVVHAYSN